jgi:hypothetical protein
MDSNELINGGIRIRLFEGEEYNKQVVKGLKDWYLQAKKEGINKRKFNIEFNKYIHENQKLLLKHPEYVFIHGMNEIITLAKAVREASLDIKALRDFPTPKAPPNLEKAKHVTEENIRERLSSFVEISKFDQLLEKEVSNKEAVTSEFKKLLYPQLFLNVISKLEVYLESRIVLSMSNSKAFRNLLKNMKDKDIPHIKPDVWVFEPHEVFRTLEEKYFRFPYHDFERRVRHRYIVVFGIDIAKFKRWDKLIQVRDLRHLISHKSATFMGIRMIDITYRDIKSLAKLVLEFVEFIEKSIPDDLKEIYLEPEN